MAMHSSSNLFCCFSLALYGYAQLFHLFKLFFIRFIWLCTAFPVFSSNFQLWNCCAMAHQFLCIDGKAVHSHIILIKKLDLYGYAQLFQLLLLFLISCIWLCTAFPPFFLFFIRLIWLCTAFPTFSRNFQLWNCYAIVWHINFFA